MEKKQKLFIEFKNNNGIVTTKQLNDLGLSSRQIKRLVDDKIISKIKQGFYRLFDEVVEDEIIISKLFPDSILFLESALFHYQYTDRVPYKWQIAVDRDSEKKKYRIDYPLLKPFYTETKYLDIGRTYYQLHNQTINIYNRDRTICDVLRYEHKLEKEIVTNAIKRYISDPKKNIRQFIKYAKVFNISKKANERVGMWF